MTNLANWHDDIEALGADFDGSLSGLCIMSLSFDFTRSGLGAAGAASAASGHNAAASAVASGSHFNQNKSASTTSANVEPGLASGALATLGQHSQSSSRLSSTSALGLHHHHHHQELLNENSMNAFKRFKSSLKANQQQGNSEQQSRNTTSASNDEDANRVVEVERDEQRLSVTTNLAGNEQIVRQLQNQLKNCLTSATASLGTNSTLTTHYSSISLANHHLHSAALAIEAPNNAQVSAGPTLATAKRQADQNNDNDERASSTCTPTADSAHSRASSSTSSDLEDQDDEEERNDDDDHDDDEDSDEDAHDDSSKSSASSISSSISADDDIDDEEDDNQEQRDEAQTGGSRSPSPSADNNTLHKDSRDLRINTTNIAHKASETNKSSRRGELEEAREKQRSRKARKSSLGGRGRDSSRPDVTPRQLSSFSIKDNLLNGGTLKESSYTTSVITTTAPMQFKGAHHHHAHPHSRPFSMKHTFPPSPYHQFSNSSFNHDLYDRYVSHDGHQPLQTPLIGIERTQDLLSLKLPPHGLDSIDTDSQRCTKDWLFGATGGATIAETNNPKIDPTPPQPSAAHENNDKSTSHNQSKALANDLSISNNHQDADTKRRRLFGADNQRDGHNSAGRSGHRRDSDDIITTEGRRKSFQFSYKSSSNTGSTIRANNSLLTHLDELQADCQREPIDLNVSYSKVGQDPEEQKSNMFDESMKHFNPNRMLVNCYSDKQADQDGDHQSHQHEQSHEQHHHHHSSQHQGPNENNNNSNNNNSGGAAGTSSSGNQYHGQESMFGLDQASKQKFQYVLAAPISVATKITEDTMTYLNQGQAYEIKLENIADVSEVKKGFMCSIINIGFHERHMQQMENALWQQWSQQHPGERIFSVDMKLSYNVFGVESDGLNKYEFLWDSSKAAGVFIRINSISTEFTPRKHGGEKGIPFKLSIETFSYNSKTHDSYFISAACCQIKVFKPKGAERKIRSDRDKIFKRPPSEFDKYHQSCDHTIFKDCSLSSLHPLVADNSIGYYRHSHGHFASKQNNSLSARCTPAANTTPTSSNSNRSAGSHAESNQQHRSQALAENNDNDHSPASSHRKSQHHRDDSDNSRSAEYLNHARGTNDSANPSITNRALSDYSTNRLLQSSNSLSNYRTGSLDESSGQQGNNYGSSNYESHGEANNELTLANHFGSHQNEMSSIMHGYHQASSNSGIQRSLSSLATSSHNGQPFGMSYYSHHHGINSHQASSHGNNSNGGHVLQSPAQPPTASLVNQHSHYGGLSLSSGNVSTSALGPAYQAAAAAAASATTRAMPANIYRQLSLGEKSISNQSHSVTPFRASNLALASNHHDSTATERTCDDTNHSQQDINKETAQQQHNLGSLNPYHQHSEQNLHQHGNSFESPHQLESRSHIALDHTHNHNHPPSQSSTTLPQLYRQRSASTSLANNLTHSSGYLSGGSLVHHHHHHQHQQGSGSVGDGAHGQLANHQRPVHMIADCYNSLNDSANNNSNNNNTWSSSLQHSNPNCLSRGCNSISHHCYNSANLHHHHAYQPTNSSTYSHQQHVQEHPHNHYEQHSEQDSPQKSHNSNDSPLSCYSRYRDNVVNANQDNNNSMSSYTSQQQQQSHYGQHQHSNDQQHLEHRHEHDDDKRQQEQSLDNMSRSSSSLLGSLSERIATSTSCAEVLAWLVANRFAHLTKTFNNFSGADLLRLSKSELVEICGLPDGIRLFNSLHDQPTRTKRKTFRTLRLAQMKRDIKLKRRLK